MKCPALWFGLAIVALGTWTSAAEADILAQYDALGAATNPNTQGWTWNGGGNVVTGNAALLITGGGTPPILFTKTVPPSVFSAPWSFTGNIRLAGNSQEEFSRMMFVDDGTNIWHLSFLNTGTDAVDGIYNGGDPTGPVLSNTATKIWPEPVPAKPFDGFHDYALVDTDGAGATLPQLYVDGAPVSPAVFALATPSKFPSGTVGFGSLNPNEAGFFQTTKMTFVGTVPEPASMALGVMAVVAIMSRTRERRRCA